MSSLSSHQLLRIWEYGRNQHPVDQALTLLSLILPDQNRSELAELSIGQRDNYLLVLREKLFGETLYCAGACPDCMQAVDILLTTKDIKIDTNEIEQGETELAWKDIHIAYRSPNSTDLAAIANTHNDQQARLTLIQRCLLKIDRQGVAIAAEELPEQAILKTEQAIIQHDPQAEILLDMSCPECGTQWQLLFDIVDFLWTEIAVKAKRLLQEVHTLAKTYGWTEGRILQLSDTRRQIYLGMISV